MLKKCYVLIWAFCLLNIAHGQELQSPNDFLGYQLGTKYTLHHRILEYFNYLTKEKPTMIKKISYGKTYEGRELTAFIISSSKNIENIESIRQNNVNLALNGTTDGNLNKYVPIIWLSYNVHGNEPASSEAAMKTAYKLLNPNHAESKAWLENAVVVIDPCINPDGRDRYANWVTNTMGRHYNPNTNAREHIETNPSGRTNHYNFDLNRDWCWQTQIESQQRIVLYHKWLPQVHVDFHEQGPNQPYYFAPAAEPYHELITPFQREFQVEIGKNNAAYFDKNNWLFFTRERFDLLYPSYGDTYPTYLGSIGMTYEQGGISGALGIITEMEDTLTLVDRVEHHYTTSMSTIEVSAKHAAQLIQNFNQFYIDNRAGNLGETKTYILTANNNQVIEELKELLDKNKIEYGQITNSNLKGYNYFTEKEENVQLENYHLAISLLQPQSRLAKILLEPKTILVDSNTYDITSWSLAYNYNLKTYSVKEALKLTPCSQPKKSEFFPEHEALYGYLIPYQSFTDAKIVAALLKEQIKIRFCRKNFVYNNQKFTNGCLAILANSNPSHWRRITEKICASYNITPIPLKTGLIQPLGPDLGSPDFGGIAKAPNVGLITGSQVNANAAGEIWHYFDYDLNYPITLLNYTNNNRFNLNNIDVLIIADGYYDFKNSEAGQFEKIKTFVQKGGKLITIDNATRQLIKATDWGLKIQESKEEEKLTLKDLVPYQDLERDYLKSSIPGAIYTVKIDKTHPLCYGFDNNFYILKQDDILLELSSSFDNVGNLAPGSYVTGFAGINVKNKLNKEGNVMGSLQVGQGNVVFFTDDIIFRQFWQSGKRILANAIFFVGK